MMKLLSIDAETDGLWGAPFAIGAVVTENTKVIAEFFASLPSSVVTDKWTKENVCPTLPAHTHETLDEMLLEFAVFYNKYRKEYSTLYHMGHIVESNLFRLLVEKGFIGIWDAPYTPIEVSMALRLSGEDPDSVDKYLEEHDVTPPYNGSTHNPLYDCYAATWAYLHIILNNPMWIIKQ